MAENTDNTTEVDEHKFTAEQDTNGNGVIDDEELTDIQKEDKEAHKLKQKDLLLVYYVLYGFSAIILITKFVSFVAFGITLNINVSYLATVLNIFICFVGVAEGIRSFTKTATEDENSPVPMYKLKILFWYMLSFIIMTIVVVTFTLIIKYLFADAESVPDFSIDNFLEGLSSIVVSYCIARFGNKVSENIDLSNFKFIKK